ncbi:MAG: YybH family protein [Telluria sp.]
MSVTLRAVFLGAALACSPVFAADVPSFVGRHESTPEDIAAIRQVTQDFQAALVSKDIRLLSSLMLNSNILWASPAGPAGIARVRANIDVNFDGLSPYGYPGFAEFIKTEKGRVEERFYDIRITQDRNVAFVMFDFDFRIDDKVINHGVEMWQMLKGGDGKWKIASVYWSSKGVPK